MTTIEIIRQWIEDNYEGGLIPFSEIDQALNLDSLAATIDVVFLLKEMEGTGEIKLITRYFCPDSHYLGEGTRQNGHCPDCDYTYPLNQIEATHYVKPLKVEPIPTKFTPLLAKGKLKSPR